jgi:hypothetical protein
VVSVRSGRFIFRMNRATHCRRGFGVSQGRPGWVWRRESLLPHQSSNPELSSRSESLYRLRHFASPPPLLLLNIYCKESMCSVFDEKNNKFVSLSLNKYLYSGSNEIKVNMDNSSEKKKPQNTVTVGELITAECASVADVYISYTQRSGRLECHS